MPEYSLSLRSNSKPVFGSPKAVVMQTKDEVNGEKKWVLGFELPDLTGIHKDLVALQINGTSYAVDGTKGQGAAALTSMGSSLTAIDKVAVKDGGGAFFQPSVSDRGIYFVTDDKIGTSQTYTIKLIDKAGLEATLPPVSTTDTTYGKEIVSFAFESSKNSSQSLGQDLTGSINGTSITIPVPASLATMNRTALTPTIPLSGGEVSPKSGEQQDFSKPVTYTVTATDGTKNTYTVTLDLNLPKPQLDMPPDRYTIDAVSMDIKPTNTLPAGTILHYTVNGGTEQTANPAVGIQLPAKVDTSYDVDCWFECSGYNDSEHFSGTYHVELNPAAIIATVKSKDTQAQPNETQVNGSQPTTFTHSFDGYSSSTVTFSSTVSGVTLKVNGNAPGSYHIGPSQTETYTVTSHDSKGIQIARTTVFTITSSRTLPAPRLTSSVAADGGGTYTVHYPAETIALSLAATSLPAGTRLKYSYNNGQTTELAATGTAQTITLQKGTYTDFTYWYECTGFTSSATVTDLGTFTVESRLSAPVLDISGQSSNSGTKYYTTTGSVTVRATNTAAGTSVPSGTTLKYKIDNGNENQRLLSGSSIDVTTLDIQGNAYTVTAWYECSGYESSTTTTQSYTVWADSSTISASASSKNGTANTATATGSTSQVSFTHNFYGVEGTTVTFSYTGGGNGISPDTTSESLCPTTSPSTSQNYTVYAKKNGQTVSDAVQFHVTSTMKPITFTLTALSLYVGFDDSALAGNPDVYGEIKVNNLTAWSFSDNGTDWSPDPFKWHTPTGGITKRDVICYSPQQEVPLWGNISEEGTGHQGTGSIAPTAETLYSNTEQTIYSSKWNLRFTFSKSQP